jgi:hypothetical protein
VWRVNAPQDGDCYTFNSFAEDGTRNAALTRYFPVTPYGQILTDPATDVAARFAGLPNLAAQPRYNPYIASPPNYDGSSARQHTLMARR